jgi:hypothetical protein
VAIWNRITALVTGGAVATAAADAMKPEFEVLTQTAWANEPHKVLPAGVAAEVRARETVDTAPGIDTEGVNLSDDAARGGLGSHRFNVLTELARTTPGMSELLTLRRRGIATQDAEGIQAAEFRHLLRRQGYAAAWITEVEQLLHERLDMGQIPAAIHRGLIPSQGLLLGEQPQPPFKVEAYPEYQIDAVAEAQSRGFDKERLGVLVGLQGLPMGVIEAAQALYRGIITHGDYIRAFNTSNSRNEWASAVLEYARQIPTARDFFENALRGYHEFPWAVEQAKRHGMSEADALVIYQNQGRPMNIRQITQALSRGAKFHPEPGELTDPYEAATVEGSVKPAYYELFKALKYTLPSPFVMRSLTESGVWTEEKTAKRLKDIGWIPDDADEAAKAWSKGGAAKADPYVARAETQLWTATHKAFLVGDLGTADAVAILDVLGLNEAAKSSVIGLWANEQTVIRARLTAAQLKKAWQKMVTNPLTGAAWTREEALAELLDRGWNQQDANTFLNTPTK